MFSELLEKVNKNKSKELTNRYMNTLEKVMMLTFYQDSSSEEVWWYTRLLFVLFVNFFGPHNVNPSLCELATCGSFYAKRIEDLGVKSAHSRGN
jgi:hypothetical protein